MSNSNFSGSKTYWPDSNYNVLNCKGGLNFTIPNGISTEGKIDYSGASPVENESSQGTVQFTGLSSILAGGYLNVQWDKLSLTSSTVVLASLVDQNVDIGSGLTLYSFAPTTGNASITLFNPSGLPSGPGGSVKIAYLILK